MVQTRPATLSGEPALRSGGGDGLESSQLVTMPRSKLIAGITQPDQHKLHNNPSTAVTDSHTSNKKRLRCLSHVASQTREFTVARDAAGWRRHLTGTDGGRDVFSGNLRLTGTSRGPLRRVPVHLKIYVMSGSR
jgi:hypothetical protein